MNQMKIYCAIGVRTNRGDKERMETTLEVRWFVRGMPPATVHNWFNYECPGKLLTEELEVREDLYAYQKYEDVLKLRSLAPQLSQSEEINLKIREGNLELKIRQEELGTEQFRAFKNSNTWKGNIEKWCKWTEEDLGKQNYLTYNVMSKNPSISVLKKRKQRLDRHVKSELTWLRIGDDNWWSVAFEMITNGHNKHQLNKFKQSVNRASAAYFGPQLSLENSYGYGHWVNSNLLVVL